jgi:hypothetical protein
MQSFRVHSVHQTAFGKYPFLVLNRRDEGKVEFDLSCLGNDHLPHVQVPLDSVYDVLEGRCVDIDVKTAYLAMTPLGDRVLIECTGQGGSVRQFLWMAELALAWNLMSRTPGWKFHVA